MSLRIKNIIKEKGTSVQELADKMGISRVGLSQHINGNPSVEVLERIASALEVGVSDLFESNSKNELTALIEHQGHLYKAKSIDELENLLAEIKEKP